MADTTPTRMPWSPGTAGEPARERAVEPAAGTGRTPARWRRCARTSSATWCSPADRRPARPATASRPSRRGSTSRSPPSPSPATRPAARPCWRGTVRSPHLSPVASRGSPPAGTGSSPTRIPARSARWTGTAPARSYAAISPPATSTAAPPAAPGPRSGATSTTRPRPRRAAPPPTTTSPTCAGGTIRRSTTRRGASGTSETARSSGRAPPDPLPRPPSRHRQVRPHRGGPAAVLTRAETRAHRRPGRTATSRCRGSRRRPRPHRPPGCCR